MQNLMQAVFSFALACGVVSSANAKETLIPINPFPKSVETVVTGINDKNIIVGYYKLKSGAIWGFYGPLNGKYKRIGASDVDQIRGINNAGVAVGDAGAAVTGGRKCPFVYNTSAKSGECITLQKGTTIDGYVYAINNDGTFVGIYKKHQQLVPFYGENGQVLNALSLPPGGDVIVAIKQAYPLGINDSGDVVGNAVVETDTEPYSPHGFWIHAGVTHLVDYPKRGAYPTTLTGINDSGLAIGTYGKKSQSVVRSFLYNTATEKFSSIKVSGAKYVWAYGINKRGVVVLNTDVGNFAYCKGSCPLATPQIGN